MDDRLGINISAAARQGVAAAVRIAFARADRAAYMRHPERGDDWLAEVGSRRRPVLVLTRDEVIDVRVMVIVAEITTTVRGLGLP